MKRFYQFCLTVCLTLLCILFVPCVAQAAKYTPGQVKGLKATAAESSVSLKWKKVSKATGYFIYRIDGKTGEAVQIASTKSTKYTAKKLKNGTAYTFQVAAYRTAKSKTYIGALSKKVTVTPMVKKPGKPKPSVTNCSNGTVTLKWSAISGASGYELFQMDSKSGKYVSLGTVKGTSVLISQLTNNVTYKFKVRAFRKVSGITRYGNYSSVISAKPLSLTSEIKSIQSMTYKAKVTRTMSCPVVVNGKVTKQRVTVKAGTSVTVTYYTEFNCTVQLSNKTKVSINRDYLDVTSCVYNSKGDYSNAAKEGFVNAKGFYSNSNYLIWISLYRQKLYIFRGSKNNWKLYMTVPCSSGKAATATPRGEYWLWKKGRYMQFDEYSYAEYASYFSDNAIHSWVKLGKEGNYTGQRYNDGKLGKPASHGCVRVSDENSFFIYDSVPMYSRIVIY